MSMFDALEVFSDAQSLAVVVSTVLSDKSIDLWSHAAQASVLGTRAANTATPMVDFGRGEDMEAVIVVKTACDVTNSPTVIFELVMADDEALTTNLTVLQGAPGGSITVGIAAATLVVGYMVRLALPHAGITRRYLGLRYRILTGTIVAFVVHAYLATVVPNPPGVTV